MKTPTKALGLLLLPSFTAFAETYVLLAERTKGMTPAASQMVCTTAASEFTFEWGPDERLRYSQARVVDSLEHIQSQFIEQQEKIRSEGKSQRLKSQLFHKGGEAAQSVLGTGGLPGKAGSAVLGLGLELSKIEVENHLQDLENTARLKTQEFVAHHYLAAKPELQATLDQIAQLPPEEAKAQAEALSQKWVEAATGGIENAEDRTAAEQNLTSMVIQVLTSETVKNNALNRVQNQEIRKQGAEIEAQGAEIVGLQQTVTSYHKQTQKSLQSIATNQREILGGLKEIHEQGMQQAESMLGAHKKLDDIQSDLGFANEFLYSQMSVSQKIDALNKGMLKLDEKSKKERLEKLELVKKQQEVIDDANLLLNGAQVLADLAGKFGMDPELVGVLSQSAQRGQNAVDSAQKFLSGDYLGAVSSLASALFGGGPSVEETRHNQVMKQLGALAAGQKKILEGQKTIVENQQIILDEIKSLSKQMQDFSAQVKSDHQKILSKLDEMHRDIIINRELGLNIATQNLRACDRFLGNETRSKYDFRDGYFATYSDMEHFFFYNREDWDDCRKGLRDSLLTSELSTSLLAYDFWIRSREVDTYNFVDQIYAPTWSYVSQKTGLKEVEVLYSSEALLKVSEYVLELAPWFELVQGSGDQSVLIPYQDLGTIAYRSRNGEVLVDALLQRTREALLQEQILGGTERIFEYLAEDLRSKIPELRAEAESLLKANPLLGENFVRWALGETLNREDLVPYEWARRLDPSFSIFSQVAKSDFWTLHYQDKEALKDGAFVAQGWSFKIGQAYFSAPEVGSIEGSSIRYRSVAQDLAKLEERLIIWLSEAKLIQHLDEEHRQTFAEIFVRHPTLMR